MSTDAITTPPSAVAFKDALKKGLGRAMLLLKAEPGSHLLQAELARACKINLVYDSQCEEPRAAYLYRLIRETGQVQFYMATLSRCLGDGTEEGEESDLTQAFCVLCLAAADERDFDRSVLYDFLARGDFASMFAFVGLEGIEGLLRCVRKAYHAFNDNFSEEDGWAFRSLVEALVNRDGAEKAAASLHDARSSCDELDRLMSLNESKSAPAVSKDASVTDDAAAEAAFEKGCAFPRAWIAAATDEALARIADALLAERDESKIRGYLRVFRIRTFPRSPRSLFPLAQSENRRVAHVAADALGRIHDPDVRALAFEFLSEGKSLELAVKLLRRNFRPGDFNHIEDALASKNLDDDAWHRFGFSLLDVIRNNEVSANESRRLLFRLYEEGPCSMCRTDIVARLRASGGVPDWMAEECLFDANPETARLFAETETSGQG